jgi:DNA-binding NarL/FixJ family response regulator
MDDDFDFSGWPTFPCAPAGDWVEIAFATDVMTYREFPRWLLELVANHNMATRGDTPTEREILSRMTPRQREVIELRRKGLTQEEVGEGIGITRQGVGKHLTLIKKKI